MKLQRFFIEEHLRNKKDISLYDEDLIHQLKDVFRLRAGNQLMLLDNSGFEYLSEIVILAKGKLEIKIIEATAGLNTPVQDVWLFASLIKKDNFEWILEKGTELGVSHFVPILAERSEKKDLNVERAHKIIKEASEQSERAIMPVLHEVLTLEAALTHAHNASIQLLTFHLGETLFDAATYKTKHSHFSTSLGIPRGSTGICIGPEGGWTPREVELFKQQQTGLYSLGHAVLRAETAAIAAAALLLL